ncbi:MAG: AAA family ATPase [Desulfobacteraceae bacterium]|nr:MAG: AAA family ATPase [Desulfobacteraceae bacterium]
MYTSFFGFKEKPFNLTPDARYLFLSPHHKEALDHLLYGINERKGFIAITGGIGTGKTTLCRTLLGHLDTSTKSALIFNSFISDEELLKTIIQEFDIEIKQGAGSKNDYVDVLNQFLLQNFSQGGNAVLLIDEAQNLSHTVLEQIRMLSNLETEKEKLIQIILVGQYELAELLATPSLRQLNERITVRYDLKPLKSVNIKGYVEHRLVVAGGRGNVRFTNGAFGKIYAYSQGNPRRINAVCDRALLIAYAKEEHIISKGMVGKAIKDFSENMAIDHSVLGWPRRRAESATVVVLFLVLLIILAGLAGLNFRNHIEGLFSGGREAAVVKDRNAGHVILPVKAKSATLYLDEKTSLAGLFDRSDIEPTSSDHLGLFSFDVAPEYYVMLKKPFRIHLFSDSLSPSLTFPRYLLIHKVKNDGAIAVDAEGMEQTITRGFILRNWGQKVSWVYPYKNKDIHLMKGMRVSDVLKVQRILNDIGYIVRPTGVYDESTFNGVMKFQEDFGLMADGIVGLRTRALLYQMVD